MTSGAYHLAEHFLVPWSLLVAVSLTATAFGPWLMLWDEWAFLLAVIVVGIPHVAADAALPQWARGRSFILGEWLGFLAFYAVGCAAMFGLWTVSPFGAIGCLMVMTLFHWGTGDSFAVVASRRDAVALGLARGGLLIHAPVAFYPTAVASFTSVFPFAGELAPLEVWFEQAPLILLACLILEVMVAAFPSQAPSPEELPGFRLHLMETPVLLLLFWTAPPILALTTYFVGFHAWRHLLRAVAVRAEVARDVRPGIAESLMVFYLRSFPFTAVGYLIIVLVFFALSFSGAGPEAYALAFLEGMVIITLPHLILTSRLDWGQDGSSGGHSQDSRHEPRLPGMQSGLLRILKK